VSQEVGKCSGEVARAGCGDDGLGVVRLGEEWCRFLGSGRLVVLIIESMLELNGEDVRRILGP